MRRNAFFALAIQLIFGTANAQTTAGIGTTIVFPVDAQTVSFASEMTLFNPGPSLLTASVKFYEANNSGAFGQNHPYVRVADSGDRMRPWLRCTLGRAFEARKLRTGAA